MDGLNKEVQEKASVIRQLDHLGSEINNLDESLKAMHDKLGPLLPPPSPVTAGDGAKLQQESSMMDLVTGLTSRIRSMNSGVCHVMEEIQI